VIAPAGLLRFKWTYLIVGAILIAVGVGVYATAHPAAPVEIDGTVADYTEFTQNGVYDRNELKLANDSNTYTLDKTTFHPSLPDSLYRDGKVNLWVDQGSTTVIGITLYDGNDQNPIKYTTDRYDNPTSARSDGQSFGIVIGVFGAIFVGVFALWFALGRGRRRTAAPLVGDGGGLPVPATAATATPRAARGQDVEAVPAASGATPPVP
jgi:hypothetical protein